MLKVCLVLFFGTIWAITLVLSIKNRNKEFESEASHSSFGNVYGRISIVALIIAAGILVLPI